MSLAESPEDGSVENEPIRQHGDEAVVPGAEGAERQPVPPVELAQRAGCAAVGQAAQETPEAHDNTIENRGSLEKSTPAPRRRKAQRGSYCRGAHDSEPDEDLVRQYLNEIGLHPLLTKDDEVRLAQAIEAGSVAKAKLEAHTRIPEAKKESTGGNRRRERRLSVHLSTLICA